MPAPITITEIHPRDPEYAEVTNRGAEPFDLSGHVLNAGDAGQDFTFPDGTVLAPGQSVRVYTDKTDLEAGEFSYGSATPIWNNDGDVARLKSPGGFQLASARFPRRPGSALLGGARSPLNRGSLSGLGKLGQTSKPKAAEPPAAEASAEEPAAEEPAAEKPIAEKPTAEKPAAKPAAPKSAAAKPAAPKPAAKPAATKPAPKPAAAKPAPKPAAAKPAAPKPAAPKPAAKPPSAKPAATKPAAPKPAAEPAVTKPAAKPAAPKPVAKPATAAKPAAAKPAAPIVVDMGRQKRGRVKRLRQGRGRLMNDLQQTIADLGEAGVVEAGAQTVIIVVEKKSKGRGWML